MVRGALGAQGNTGGMCYDSHPSKMIRKFDFLIILCWIIAILVKFHVFFMHLEAFESSRETKKQRGDGLWQPSLQKRYVNMFVRFFDLSQTLHPPPLLPNPLQVPSSQGGTGIRKKDPGSIFFLRLPSAGLTNYVIRHMSWYSKNIKLRLKWQLPSCHFVPSRLLLPVRVCWANRAFFGNLVYIPLCLILNYLIINICNIILNIIYFTLWNQFSVGLGMCLPIFWVSIKLWDTFILQ